MCRFLPAIRERDSRGYHVASAGYHLLALVVATSVQGWLAVPFGLYLARALALPGHRLKVQVVGVIEIVNSALLLAALVGALSNIQDLSDPLCQRRQFRLTRRFCGTSNCIEVRPRIPQALHSLRRRRLDVLVALHELGRGLQASAAFLCHQPGIARQQAGRRQR